MLKKIAIGIVAVIGILILVSFFLPSKIHLERDIVINVPPAKVYPYVSNFKKFNEWSPWVKLDPNVKYNYSGPDSGVGAKVAWDSDNPQVGSGSQEIVEAEPNKRIKNKLTFDGQSSFATYTLTPVEKGTKIVWTFDNELGMNPIGRYIGLFIEGMLATTYEEGLKSLKDLAEKS